MAGVPGFEGPQNRGVGNILDYTASTSQVLGATAQDAWLYNPTPALFRALGDIGTILTEDPTKRITQEAAQTQMNDAGVKLTAAGRGYEQATLDELIQRKKDENTRQTTLARSAGGFGLGAAKFGVGLVVSFADPLNIATGMLPVGRAVGATRAAMNASTHGGKALSRFGLGLAEGAVGSVLTEPIILTAASLEQSDYNIQDSMMNMVFGGVIGGGLHVGVGRFIDAAEFRSKNGRAAAALNEMNVDDKTSVLRVGTAQLAGDSVPNLGPVLDAIAVQNKAQATQSARAALRGGVSPTTFTPVSEGTTSLRLRLEGVRKDIEANNRGALTGVVDEALAPALARKNNPKLFNKADDLETRIDSHVRWLDELRGSKSQSPEVLSLESDIIKLQETLARVKPNDKLRLKQVNDQIVAATNKLDVLKKTDTIDQKLVRTALVELRAERERLGPDINSVVERQRNKIRNKEEKAASQKVVDDINAELHRQEIELEARLLQAENADITNGSFKPGLDGVDYGTKEGVRAEVNRLVEVARFASRDDWRNKTYNSAKELDTFDKELSDLNELTDQELDAKIADTEASLSVREKELGLVNAFVEDTSFDITQVQDNMASFASCKLGV